MWSLVSPPPYDLVGWFETLGFEAWIEKSNELDGYSFCFKLETMLSMQESFENKMHDLSLWMARFISSVCEIETYVSLDDGHDGVAFS